MIETKNSLCKHHPRERFGDGQDQQGQFREEECHLANDFYPTNERQEKSTQFGGYVDQELRNHRDLLNNPSPYPKYTPKVFVVRVHSCPCQQARNLISLEKGVGLTQIFQNIINNRSEHTETTQGGSLFKSNTPKIYQ